MEPVLGGKKIDLYKLFQAVSQSGGFDKVRDHDEVRYGVLNSCPGLFLQVTKNRTWKQIGDCFEFPPTCTNSAYILKGLYIRNLVGEQKGRISSCAETELTDFYACVQQMGWEEEKVWGKEWIPPVELLGPVSE